jgi:predicted nucleotide-binding protein
VKMSRKLPTQDVDDVLIKSRRRCALCYASGDATLKSGNIAHIEPLRAHRDETADNLIFLCTKHLRETHERKPKAPTAMQLRAWRARLYEAISKKDHTRRTSRPKAIIAHGRDRAVTREIADFLTDRDVEPIILTDRRDSGISMLERLDSRLSADFAIVVVDMPASKNLNVFLEIGFLFARLGHQRVCVLAMPDVEVPRDIGGALLIQKDVSGRWMDSLTRKLAAAGIGVQSPG